MYGPQGEAERFGPACRVRELGVGAGRSPRMRRAEAR